MTEGLDIALRIQASVGQALESLNKVQKELGRIGTGGVRAGAGAEHAATGIHRAGAAAQGAVVRVRDLVKGFLALYVVNKAHEMIGSLVEANIQMQQMQFTLLYATGSARAAQVQMQFLGKTAKALGIDLREGGLQFAKLLSAARGQGVTVGTIQSLYLGLAKTFDILHTKTTSQQRVMQAFVEMLSMGTIHAQQFSYMLHRDLPGVNFLGIASKALGITQKRFSALLNAGQLTAQEVFPALAQGLNASAASGSALNEAIHGTNATLNRLHNATFTASANISRMFVPALAAAADETAKVTRVMSPLNTKISESGRRFSGFRYLIDTIGNALILLGDAGETIGFTAIGVAVSIKNILNVLVSQVTDLLSILKHGVEEIGDISMHVAQKTGDFFKHMGSVIKDAATLNFGAAGREGNKASESLIEGFGHVGKAASSQFAEMKHAFTDYEYAAAAGRSHIGASWSAVASGVAASWSAAMASISRVEVASAVVAEPMPTAKGQTPHLTPHKETGKEELAALHTQLLAARAASAERVQLAEREVAVAKAAYGTESNEYQSAMRDMNTAVQAHARIVLRLSEINIDAQRKAALDGVQSDRTALQQRIALGQVGAAEKARDLRALEDHTYAIERQALQRKLALMQTDVVATRQIQNQIAALARHHAGVMQGINNHLVLNIRQTWVSNFQIITSAVDQSIQGMIRGTTTWRNAMRNLFQSMLGEFISSNVRRVANWAATQIGLTSITVAGEGTRLAIQHAADRESLLSTAITVAKRIAMKVWEVMASVYAAIAGIPYVGPFLAPAMAVAAGALVAGWAGRVASASGGWWEIPNDQLAVVHQKEMVLPAREAEGIRGLVRNGGGGGDIHLHVQAADGDSVRRLFLDHPDELAEALRGLHRNGAFA